LVDIVGLLEQHDESVSVVSQHVAFGLSLCVCIILFNVFTFAFCSMGGLVVKQMLHKAKAENIDNLVNNTAGVVCFNQ